MKVLSKPGLHPSRGAIPGLAACLLALLAIAPRHALAEALEREGTVAVLPTARWAGTPSSLDNGGAAPGLTLAFGFRPTASTEVGIDVGISPTGLRGAAYRYELLSMPVLLRGSWTPAPRWDLRPVLHAGIGKNLLLVYGRGSEYREHTPMAAMAALGLQADLSTSVGLAADVGYLYARADDPRLGSLDAGGPFLRTGVYFRWEPVRRLGR